MHQGQVIEEGDHESLMNARGSYFNLVEQQNLMKAEEEDQLTLEISEANGLIQADGDEELPAHFTRRRKSTIASMAPSITQELYGKKENSTSEEDNAVAKKKKVKIIFSFIS